MALRLSSPSVRRVVMEPFTGLKAPPISSHTHRASLCTSTSSRRIPCQRTRPSAQTTLTTQALTYQLQHRRSNSSQSASPMEISHFDSLASSWWDPQGSSALLHAMNPLRHTFIRDCIASSPTTPKQDAQLSYLDVGCGGGIFTESAARLATTGSVVGLDPSTRVLEIANAHARQDPTLVEMLKDGELEYRNGTIDSIPTPALGLTEGFDVVTAFEVLEHVPHPSEFLSSLGSQVKPGGWLILSTISRTWTSWVTTKLVAEHIAGLVPVGTHDWNKYLNEDEVRNWFSRRQGEWIHPRSMGVVYVPGVGWREVPGSASWGNYFFGVQKAPASD